MPRNNDQRDARDQRSRQRVLKGGAVGWVVLMLAATVVLAVSMYANSKRACAAATTREGCGIMQPEGRCTWHLKSKKCLDS
jgi:hypothetical protein